MRMFETPRMLQRTIQARPVLGAVRNRIARLFDATMNPGSRFSQLS